MKTKTINKNNWSGEEGTYKFDDTTVVINDETFKLKHNINEELDLEWYDVFYREKSGDRKVFSVNKFGNQWVAEECGVQRESDNPYDVVAEMFWNLF